MKLWLDVGGWICRNIDTVKSINNTEMCELLFRPCSKSII
uniref:Uncharacterized protein n=1 Tax=Strix occidentalis caurina TaxID=311401 RepID=A0A8D0EX18_STROC